MGGGGSGGGGGMGGGGGQGGCEQRIEVFVKIQKKIIGGSGGGGGGGGGRGWGVRVDVIEELKFTYIRASISLKFGQIRPRTTELAALKRLKN